MEFAFIRVRYLKGFGKFIGRRFGLQHSRALDLVCRASGFDSLAHVYELKDSAADSGTLGSAVWISRLRGELGSDLEVLVTLSELEQWFPRIHGASTNEDFGEAGAW